MCAQAERVDDGVDEGWWDVEIGGVSLIPDEGEEAKDRPTLERSRTWCGSSTRSCICMMESRIDVWSL